jgi:hypothetical protein
VLLAIATLGLMAWGWCRSTTNRPLAATSERAWLRMNEVAVYTGHLRDIFLTSVLLLLTLVFWCLADGFRADLRS